MEATRGDPAFTSIVVGTAGSKRAGKAVRQATHLARSTGARLEVVSAYRSVPEQRLREQRKDVPEKYRWMVNPRQDVDTILKGAVEETRGYGVHVSGHARETDPASALLDVAEELEADLLVVGNKGMQGAHRYLGSVPSKVSHHATCSVLIVDTA
jgi:nucleotide-binding universal stress UspA family protein